jgi:uncharacterized Zn-binding protein involved in type VI secretion
MGSPAAKKGDRITALDTHLIQTPGGPSPAKFPFNGIIDGALSKNVTIQGQPAATVGSTATNTPPHVGNFVTPPTNQGRISTGSSSVRINGKPAARAGDSAFTCNDPVDVQDGTVVAISTVRIGG